MNIIRELANSSIKSNQKDTFASKLSILMAVVLLGTLVFIISSSRADKYNQIVSTVGDYQVYISGIDEQMYDELVTNQNIQQVFFDRFIQTDDGTTLCEKHQAYWKIGGYQLISGRYPSASNELLVPNRFLTKDPSLQIGSKLTIKDKTYTIVGEYDDYAYSFEDTILLGYLDDAHQETLFGDNAEIHANIWYKSPRDTYRLTQALMEGFQIDYAEAVQSKRLFFNKEILEYKMIYPSGVLPPRRVWVETLETYGPCFLLVILFAVMIYGAFNVWNNRDIREIALLKSVGMTGKQVKKMVKLKVLHLSIIPIALGTIIAYLMSNLLLYLVWLNNALTYNKLSGIFGERMRAPDFHVVPVSILPILLIVLLSFVTVYLSAILPARQSAKQKIIEGLNGISEKKVRYGKSKIRGKIETTLAKDYFRSYRATYRTIILAMLISAVVVTVVLVSQSYRTLAEKYDRYQSPYHFTSRICTESPLNRQFIEELQSLQGIDELHIVAHQDFKVFLKDNAGFVSEELSLALENGKKHEDDLYTMIYGLSDEDFATMLEQNDLNMASKFVLLNKTPANNRTPYAFRQYVPITDGENHELAFRHKAQGQVMKIPVDGYVDTFPYDLDAHEKSGIFVFTTMSNLEELMEENKESIVDRTNYYMIQIKAKDHLEAVAEQCEGIIATYIPRTDYTARTSTLRATANAEQTRNENLLNGGIQIILLMIALANAYNGFHGNLRSRKKNFSCYRRWG